MTYNVFGGTLNITQSINQSLRTLTHYYYVLKYWFFPMNCA